MYLGEVSVILLFEMSELTGQLLVASPNMNDPNFFRTVILVLRDEEDGTMGLILNRPVDISVKDACEKILQTTCEVEGNLHQGGPCEGPMMVLYSGQAYGEAMGDLKVLPGVWFITNKDEIETVLGDSDSRVRCYIGYSGWTAGQLDAEINAGAWLIHPAVEDFIFSENPRIWSKLMTRLTLGNDIDPTKIPDDPSVN